MHDIAVLHRVVLALETKFPGFARAGFAFEFHEIVIGYRLGTDETVFEVGVNYACGLRRVRAPAHGPGAHFFYTGGKKVSKPNSP